MGLASSHKTLNWRMLVGQWYNTMGHELSEWLMEHCPLKRAIKRAKPRRCMHSTQIAERWPVLESKAQQRAEVQFHKVRAHLGAEAIEVEVIKTEWEGNRLAD
eukprot:1468276-Amphidinium_carterae.1